MTRNIPFLKNFSIWLLILLPVLNIYQVGSLDLDVILMLAFAVAYVLTNQVISISPMGMRIIGFSFYILGISAINILLGVKYAYASDILLRSFKFCFYLLVLFMLFSEYLTYENIMKVYRIVAYAAAFYLFLQTVFFYGAGITLPSRFGSSQTAANYSIGRLRSFYSEPAALAYSLIPLIACSLFGPQTITSKKSLTDAVVVSIAIVLSTSGQGILAAAFLWAIWVLVRIKENRFTPQDLAILVTILLATFVLYRTGILKYALDRAGDTSEHSTIAARSSGYRTLEVLTPLQLIFGAGYGNHIVEDVLASGKLYETVNYSSLAQFLFSLGIVGTLLWFGFFVRLYRNGNLCVRMLILTLLLLSIGGAPTLPIVFPTWLALMCVQLPAGQFSRSPEDLPSEL